MKILVTGANSQIGKDLSKITLNEEEEIIFFNRTNLDVSRNKDLEKIEIIDQFQDHLLSMNNAIPTSEELYDVADLEFFPTSEDFTLFPSGLSAEYDAVNGGFATQELV